MAHLFPPAFELADLEESEQRTIEHFLTQLDNSWFVVPSIPVVVDKKDSEIDIVLLSADHGMYVVEVKGGVISVDQGQWKSNDKKIKDPCVQATQAKHALVKRLTSNKKADLKDVFVQHIVAFPDIIDFPADGGGPHVPRNIVFTKSELHLADQYLSQLRQDKSPISSSQLETLLRLLKPTIEQVSVTGEYITGASERINTASLRELRLLLGLDDNVRILLRGRAGTGKTFLAHHWAKRALARGEKTLLVCYNRALGNDLYTQLDDYVEEHGLKDLLFVGSFHAIANSLLGEHRVEVPADASQEFWNTKHADELMAHRDDIVHRFDTIIIDEGQDFRDSWIQALEGLLVDRDSSRFYITLDENQAIFSSPPSIPGRPTLFTLHHNVRSTRNVAKIAQSLGGALVPRNAPPGPRIHKETVRGMKEVKKRLLESLRHATENLDIPLSEILVLVPHNKDIDELIATPIDTFTLSRWTERAEDSITCATMQSVKGLERLAVIVISLDDAVSKEVSYVALTRASVYLSVIGCEGFLRSIDSEAPQDLQHKDLQSEEPSDKSDSQTISD